MHAAAVVLWCAVTAWLVGQNALALFVDWYSGASPPLARSTRLRLWLELIAATAAAALAVVTL